MLALRGTERAQYEYPQLSRPAGLRIGRIVTLSSDGSVVE
jgi:hypothetical protein